MRVLDLFCGAGGITRGFLRAGFDVTGADNSEHVQRTFEENNHAHFEKANLLKETISEKFDIVTGGPPCKPWSSVNVTKRRTAHMDHRLISRYFMHVKNGMPRAFLFENVPPLQNDVILRKHIRKMEQLGYSVKDQIVKYSDYGASSARRRLIVFGIRNGTASTFFRMLESRKTFPSTVRDSIEEYKDLGKGEYADHVWPELKTIDKYAEYYQTNQFGWYVLKWDEPAPSFGNVMKTYILHPNGLGNKHTRVISVREAMSIMGFDKTFRFPDGVGMGQRYQMTVDSVSPVFSQVAAEVIQDMLNDKPKE